MRPVVVDKGDIPPLTVIKAEMLKTKEVPEGVKVVVGMTQDKIPTLTITGIDKQKVGAFAAQVRAVKPPEPYQGFGIRYAGEKIIRKAGKAAAGSKK